MDCNNPFGADAEDHCTVTLYDPYRRAPQIDILISAYLADVDRAGGEAEDSSGMRRVGHTDEGRRPQPTDAGQRRFCHSRT